MNIEDEINSNQPVDRASICMIIVEYYKNAHIIFHPKIKEKKEKKLYSVLRKLRLILGILKLNIFTQILIYIMLLLLFLVVNSHSFHWIFSVN